VRVVDLGHATDAARSLFLSQSAVSMQLAAISHAVGLTLLERVRGRWVPTAAGRELYECACEVLQSVERLEQRITDIAFRQTGCVRMVCTRVVAELVLAPILAGFPRSRPDIRLDVSLDGCREVEAKISRREVEVALTAEPFDAERSSTYPVADDELLAIFAADHPLAARASVTMDQIAAGPVVLHGIGSTILGLLRERLGDRFDDLHVLYELSSSEAVISCVEAGLGASFLPARVAKRATRWARVVALPVSDVGLRRKIIVATPAGETSAAAQAFIAWLRAAADVLAGDSLASPQEQSQALTT